MSEGRKAEHGAGAGAGAVPDPQDEATFRSAKLAHRRDGRHGALWRHHRELLRVRRRHAEALGRAWPEVQVEGRAVRLRRPGLEVAVNLGPAPAAGLPGWGWGVREG